MTNQILPAVEREIEKRAEEYYADQSDMLNSRHMDSLDIAYSKGAISQYLEDRKVIEGLVRECEFDLEILAGHRIDTRKHAHYVEVETRLFAQKTLEKLKAWKGKE